jgi:hypothetical protein
MSEHPKPHFEDTERQIIQYLRQFPHTKTFQEVAYAIEKPRDETIYYANQLREKGIIYTDLNLSDLRITGDTTGIGLTDFGRDVL